MPRGRQVCERYPSISVVVVAGDPIVVVRVVVFLVVLVHIQ